MDQLRQLIKFIDEKQGQEIKVLDMRNLTPYIDFMIVTHLSNPRLLKATAEYIADYLDTLQIEYRPYDKNDESGWILIDAHHLIIHLFLEEQRNLYQLEKLWKDVLLNDESLTSL